MRRLSLNRSEPAKKSGPISRKIVAGQQYLSGWWKRERNCPFSGIRSVCLGRNQAARDHVAATRRYYFSRCTCLFLRFWAAPTHRGDRPYDRLSTGMDIHMLYCDAVLTFAAMTVEGFDQSREGPGELVRLVQVLAMTFERLLPDHRASVALHSGVMARDRLTDQHTL